MASNRQLALGCKHFTGLQNDQCAAGVAYKSLKWPFPCHRQDDGTFTGTCPLFEFHTEAEIDEQERQTTASVKRWLENMAANVCPWCGKSTEPKRQDGRCVYGACGCRLYQGKLQKSRKD